MDSATRAAAALLRVRWFVRAPIWLFRARLGGLFGSRLLMLEHVGRSPGAVATSCWRWLTIRLRAATSWFPVSAPARSGSATSGPTLRCGFGSPAASLHRQSHTASMQVPQPHRLAATQPRIQRVPHTSRAHRPPPHHGPGCSSQRSGSVSQKPAATQHRSQHRARAKARHRPAMVTLGRSTPCAIEHRDAFEPRSPECRRAAWTRRPGGTARRDARRPFTRVWPGTPKRASGRPRTHWPRPPACHSMGIGYRDTRGLRAAAMPPFRAREGCQLLAQDARYGGIAGKQERRRGRHRCCECGCGERTRVARLGCASVEGCGGEREG